MMSRTSDLSGRWRRCLLAALLAAASFGAAAQERAAQPSSEDRSRGALVAARVEHGLLTLQADDAPLAETLRAIGAAGSFDVVLRGTFATPVREAFADRPLEDAIRHLVEGHSVVFLRAAPDTASGAAALTEVRVIENPALVVPEDAGDEPPPDRGEITQGDPADDPPLDREAFRLANLGVPPPTRDDILLELDAPDQAARIAAIPKVGSLHPRAALAILADVFARDEDPLVRSRAVAALTRLGGPGARMLLREQALGDEDAELRMQALNALASSRGERSLNVLGQALRQDPDPKVRISALRALDRVGGDWARRSLERAARDGDPAISLAAEQALAAWPKD